MPQLRPCCVSQASDVETAKAMEKTKAVRDFPCEPVDLPNARKRALSVGQSPWLVEKVCLLLFVEQCCGLRTMA